MRPRVYRIHRPFMSPLPFLFGIALLFAFGWKVLLFFPLMLMLGGLLSLMAMSMLYRYDSDGHDDWEQMPRPKPKRKGKPKRQLHYDTETYDPNTADTEVYYV